MNLCLWFFGLVEFLEVSDVFFGGGRIPPERPRINTGQSGGLGDGRVHGHSPSGRPGQEVPQKLKLFAHWHIMF